MNGEYDDYENQSEEKTNDVADATNTRLTSELTSTIIDTDGSSRPSYETYLAKAKVITEKNKNQHTSCCRDQVRNKFLKFLEEEMPGEMEVEEEFLKL